MDVIGVHELKKAIYNYCSGLEEEKDPKINEEVIIPELLPVWHAFKKNGFDFYNFMVEKDYELIEDEEMRVEVLTCVCFPLLKLPIGKFAIDWLNGYLDFFKREIGDVTDTEVLHQLFFCSTDKDIWKMMASGIGDIESLYRWYMGRPDSTIEEATGIPCHFEKNKKKAAEFLDYLLDDKTNANKAVKKEANRLKTI